MINDHKASWYKDGKIVPHQNRYTGLHVGEQSTLDSGTRAKKM